jgi:hypothetical protein
MDRVVGFSVLMGVSEHQRREHDVALDRALRHFPWLARRELAVGTAAIVLWGHGDVMAAVGEHTATRIQVSVGACLEPAAEGSERSLSLDVTSPHPAAWSIKTDWTGSIPVFHASDERHSIVSTLEPVVVATAGLGSDGISPVGLTSLLTHGYFVGTSTLFRSMSALQVDAVTTWTDGSLSVLPVDSVQASDARWTAAWDDLVEEMDDLFTRSIRDSLRAEPSWTLPLSGGLDSRLIAAVARREGVALQAVTYGSRGWPDVAYAEAVARRLGIPWRRIELGTDYLSRYGSAWADWFGSSLHFHGMYQFPLAEALGTPVGPITTGFTGDPLGGAQTAAMMAGERSIASRLLGKWRAFSRDEVRELLGTPVADEAFEAIDADLEAQCQAVQGADYQRVWMVFQHNHVARFSTYQPAMYDYWGGVGCPFSNASLARFVMSLPRAALDHRRLELDVLRTRWPEMAALPGTFAPEPQLTERSYIARRALALRLPERLRRGPLQIFALTDNTTDRDCVRAHGREALWPLHERWEALRATVRDVEPLERALRSVMSDDDPYAMSKLAAAQAVALRV